MTRLGYGRWPEETMDQCNLRVGPCRLIAFPCDRRKGGFNAEGLCRFGGRGRDAGRIALRRFIFDGGSNVRHLHVELHRARGLPDDEEGGVRRIWSGLVEG